ncbi:cytochrome P450 [Neobacillus niacini]|uniref:cytochrome P450 n=1 Tax=Neobacillus niacini TaxID=86668 RepID=UPI002FFEBD97
MGQCPFTGNISTEKKVSYLVPIKELSSDSDFNNIHSWLEEKRKNSSIEYDEDRGVWNVYSYEDVEEVFKDHKRFSVKRTNVVETPFRSILNLDPPDHTKMRRLVSKAFSPKTIQSLSPTIDKVSTQLLEEFVSHNEVDIMNDYAYPLTISMLTSLLGVPFKDKDLFRYWSESLIAVPEEDSEEAYQNAISMSREMMGNIDAYLLNIIKERRQEQQDDLISSLITAEIDGELLSDREIRDFGGLLLQAGFGTTARLISNSVRCIIETPGLQQQLREDPSLISLAIEEILRLYASIYRTTRFALEDVTIQGKEIKAGEELSLWISSANRDADKFENPHQFDMGRGRNNHISFGKGIHLCIGAPLARLEAEIAIKNLLAATEWISFKDEEFKPIKSLIANGLRELRIQIDKK